MLFWLTCMQTPRDEDRAAINKPQATILYTPGLNPTLADKLSESLLPKPALQANTLLAAQQYLAKAVQELSGDLTVPGEALALLGLKRLGSSSVMKEAAGLYLEAALAPVRVCSCDSSVHAYLQVPMCARQMPAVLMLAILAMSCCASEAWLGFVLTCACRTQSLSMLPG
jgi:hypothetical protein